MENNTFMFYLFSATILFFSVLAVTSRRILRAAVFLLFALVATSGIYFMLNYQFLAGVQLSLYAGGIVVLIIFSILLTHHISHKFERPPLANLYFGLVVVILGGGLTIYTLLNYPFMASTPACNRSKHAGHRHTADGNRGQRLCPPFRGDQRAVAGCHDRGDSYCQEGEVRDER